jgi:exoribonuclease-2
VDHGVAAPLTATFKPRDAELFAIVSGFDAAYGAYADFQTNMERYWCLRWLAQQGAGEFEAVVLKEEVLRLADIPLIVRLPGMPQVARGTQVKLDIMRWNEVDLTVEARLVEIERDKPIEAYDDEPDELDGAIEGDMESAQQPGDIETQPEVTEIPGAPGEKPGLHAVD